MYYVCPHVSYKEHKSHTDNSSHPLARPPEKMASSTGLTATQYPPSLTNAEKDDLSNAVKNFAIGHGLAVRPQTAVVPDDIDPKGMLAINVPVTLFPSPFPRECFEQARGAQKTYNELYAAISRDESFLADAVDE